MICRNLSKMSAVQVRWMVNSLILGMNRYLSARAFSLRCFLRRVTETSFSFHCMAKALQRLFVGSKWWQRESRCWPLFIRFRSFFHWMHVCTSTLEDGYWHQIPFSFWHWDAHVQVPSGLPIVVHWLEQIPVYCRYSAVMTCALNSLIPVDNLVNQAPCPRKLKSMKRPCLCRPCEHCYETPDGLKPKSNKCCM